MAPFPGFRSLGFGPFKFLVETTVVSETPGRVPSCAGKHGDKGVIVQPGWLTEDAKVTAPTTGHGSTERLEQDLP